ncbi:MAG TPA: hypothetical protein VLL54_20095 [Pyrinomonadaceae bacterium]|nr:hypothetical protein [Pyrinomonadaceae bacterium]
MSLSISLWKRRHAALAALFITVFLLGATTALASRCTQLKANPDRWVTLKVDALVRVARAAYENEDAIPAYSRVLAGITTAFQQCKLREDASFHDRYRAFIEFVEVASLDSDPYHELGFVVPDKQYFEETERFVQIPQFLLDKAFIKAVSRFETLGQAKAYLRQINSTRSPAEQLIFFSYKSRHLGTPDNDQSYGRLLVVVPGDPRQGLPDKWVQFGVPDPGSRAHIRNISIVSALPGPAGTYNPYFKDFYRTYKRDGSITIAGRWELGEGDDNCAQCHKSGVLPIFPVARTVSQAEQQALLAVNERFRTYGSPRFGNYLDSRKLGPGLSSASASDRQQRFGRLFEETPAAHAMVCSSCHNADRLGALSWPMDKVIISSYVRGGQMPFGHQLKVADRRDLYTKLIEEYFSKSRNQPGVLMSWLLSRPDAAPPTAHQDSDQYQP